jgi:uncharacterized protein YndB with AHSA1/START domain
VVHAKVGYIARRTSRGAVFRVVGVGASVVGGKLVLHFRPNRSLQRTGFPRRCAPLSAVRLTSALGVTKCALPQSKENLMTEQRISQVIYIKASIDRVWDALTNPEITQKYWGNTRIESDWQVGSKIRYVRDGQVVDEHTVVEVQKPVKLIHTFQPLFGEFKNEPPSRVSLLLHFGSGVVRLTLVHDDFPPNSKVYAACSVGWPMILSALKTLLETGSPLPDFSPTE